MLATRERADPAEIERLARLIPGYDPWSGVDEADYFFDPDSAADAIRFFEEELCHTKGALAGKPFLLEDWQKAIVANLFGWFRTGGPVMRYGEQVAPGVRRYRKAMLYTPRKSGKTTLAAGLLLYVLFNDQEEGAEIYGAASEYGQATLVFEQARGMILRNDHLAERCKLYNGQAKSIRLPDPDCSYYEVVSGKASSLHGGNTHFAVIDELHTHPDRELVDTIESSTGSRERPLIVFITTADWDREGSICNEKHYYATQVRDGLIEDPEFLPVIYEADEGDDWRDEATWEKANPNLDVSLSRDYLRRECQRAVDIPAYENTFRRLHLNQKTEADVRWLSLVAWDGCVGTVEWRDLPAECEGQPCYAGVDIASTSDMTAVVLYFPTTHIVLPYYFVPRENTKTKESRRANVTTYRAWVSEGAVQATPGNTLDYASLKTFILEAAARFDVRQWAFDKWQSQQLMEELSIEGLDVFQFTQTISQFAAPTKEFERLVLEGLIQHGGHPVLRWNVGNVVVTSDTNGNLRPDKKKSNEKIDGVVGLIMAIGLALWNPIDQVSLYDDPEAWM